MIISENIKWEDYDFILNDDLNKFLVFHGEQNLFHIYNSYIIQDIHDNDEFLNYINKEDVNPVQFLL